MFTEWSRDAAILEKTQSSCGLPLVSCPEVPVGPYAYRDVLDLRLAHRQQYTQRRRPDG